MILKTIRIAIGILVLLFSVLFFVDFGAVLPEETHVLFHTQFIPAILGSKWIIVACLLLSVIVFGRVYCSVLCPLGLVQDAIGRISQMTRKYFKKKIARQKYKKPHNIIRYSILGTTVVLSLLGFTTILTLLDPYSNFGRIAVSLFKPIYVEANNLTASLLVKFDNYTLYKTEIYHNIPTILLSFVILGSLVAMAWKNGRLWCNTLCPVGVFFGLISRHSLFGITIPQAQCVSCGACMKECKAQCIDAKNKTVDHDRCVACFNCIESCPQKGLSYGWKYKREKGQNCTENKKNTSRRRFITGAATAVTLTSPLIGLATEKLKNNPDKPWLSRKKPLPPGAHPDFANRCTGCQLCVTRCPMHTLRPSFLERGVSRIMQPHMHFEPHLYCNYDCTICSEVCPNGALVCLTKEEKHLRQVGIVQFHIEQCRVKIDHVDCGACAEHCPTGAVTMVAYKDGLTIPKIEADLCIGCGGCESICPERPRAIYIEGMEPQGQAKAIIKSKKEEVEISEFGF